MHCAVFALSGLYCYDPYVTREILSNVSTVLIGIFGGTESEANFSFQTTGID